MLKKNYISVFFFYLITISYTSLNRIDQKTQKIK